MSLFRKACYVEFREIPRENISYHVRDIVSIFFKVRKPSFFVGSSYSPGIAKHFKLTGIPLRFTWSNGYARLLFSGEPVAYILHCRGHFTVETNRKNVFKDLFGAAVEDFDKVREKKRPTLTLLTVC